MVAGGAPQGALTMSHFVGATGIKVAANSNSPDSILTALLLRRLEFFVQVNKIRPRPLSFNSSIKKLFYQQNLSGKVWEFFCVP
jgi:hypothetical protein